MSICAPCQVPHTAEDCEDTLTGRTGLARACFCQHKPYSAAVPRQSAGSGEGAAGPECDPPETRTDTEAAGGGEETAHLLRSPANAAWVMESLQQARNGEVEDKQGQAAP